MSSADVVAPRRCPLCEAACGLDVHLHGGDVVAVRGRRSAVLSEGYVCGKGVAIPSIDADPDRLRRPLVRRGDGHVEVSWEDAFAEAARRLRPVLDTYGSDAVAVYSGNPGGSI